MNKLVLTLGYICLVILALYFVFGLLKISGCGLENLGKGSVIEGMTAKAAEKKIERLIDTKEKNEEKYEKMLDDFDSDEYAEYIQDCIDIERKILKHRMIKRYFESPNLISGLSPGELNNAYDTIKSGSGGMGGLAKKKFW